MAQSVGEVAIDLVVGENNIDRSIRGAMNSAQGAVDSGTNGISGALGRIGGVATKVGAVATAAVGVAATGIGAIGKQAIEEYANYEQLVGGVETLFKESKDTVMQYANDAYKTAGMSANAYMETVTSFSASLLQSVGGDTKKAADDANLAITDMSDNANKMGTYMQMIQNAYNGFAKQNYTIKLMSAA